MKKMKIKNGILILVLLAITTLTFAQSHNVTSAAIIFKQYNSERDTLVKALKIKEAKEFIDQAYNNESTSNEPKMWMVRANIYKDISFNYSDLDDKAIFKATESHLKCMQPHPKKKDKIIIYKKWDKIEVFNGLIQCANKLFNLAVEAYQEERFKESLSFYEPIYEVIELDNEGKLISIKITTESVLYNSYLAAKAMKNNELSKDFLQRLMDVNSKKPSIYFSMSNIYLEEENTIKALAYLSLGRKLFEDDQNLLNAEINLYIQLGRTSELIGKLGEAIALDEENELLYFNRGTIYDQEGDIANAEKDYLTALELNFSSFGANYNLGALYFNQGVETKNKANATSDNSLYSKLNKEADAVFAKALPYLETAHNVNTEDKNTLLSLKQLYYLNGDYGKSEEMKKLIAELK